MSHQKVSFFLNDHLKNAALLNNRALFWNGFEDRILYYIYNIYMYIYIYQIVECVTK